MTCQCWMHLSWFASKLEPKHAKDVLIGLTNWKLNKVCPLVFPDIRHVVKSCGDGMSNLTTCCIAMDSYVSHLQKQSLITNLRAVDCFITQDAIPTRNQNLEIKRKDVFCQPLTFQRFGRLLTSYQPHHHLSEFQLFLPRRLLKHVSRMKTHPL